MKIRLVAAGLLLAFSLWTSTAHAIPVEFTWTGTVTTSAIPGVAAGDSVTLQLLADNGGPSLASQTWNTGDLISGKLTADSYWQTYVDGWFYGPRVMAFQTDGVGAVTFTNFGGTTYSPNSQDSFGSGPKVNLYTNAFEDYFGQYAFYTPQLLRRDGPWTAAVVAQVPEPGMLGLVVLGLAGIGLSRRKRQ